MEQREIEILEKFSQQDSELRELWEDHVLYKKQIEKLESKSFRTPVEEGTYRQLKKQKLEGKTKLMAILDRYKSKEN